MHLVKRHKVYLYTKANCAFLQLLKKNHRNLLLRNFFSQFSFKDYSFTSYYVSVDYLDFKIVWNDLPKLSHHSWPACFRRSLLIQTYGNDFILLSIHLYKLTWPELHGVSLKKMEFWRKKLVWKKHLFLKRIIEIFSFLDYLQLVPMGSLKKCHPIFSSYLAS